MLQITQRADPCVISNPVLAVNQSVDNTQTVVLQATLKKIRTHLRYPIISEQSHVHMKP
jgi:hypothetical protein